MRRILGILSGKGGVGKTTLSLNLGLAFQKLNEECVVIDCDLKNPNLGLSLGMYDFPVTIHDSLDRDINLLEALYIHSSGLRIIPASISLDYINVDSTTIKDIVSDLKGYVLVDSAPGLGREVISVIDASDNVLIVTSPEVPAVSDAIRLIQVVKDLNKKVIGIVINRVKGRPYEIKPNEIEAVCNVPIVGIVPEDDNIKKSLSAKQPLISHRPYSPASIAFMKIAANILQKEYKPPKFISLRRMLSRF